MSTAVKIRYFAAAADAAGRDDESITIELPSTVDDLRRILGEQHGAELARVLELCSFLVEGHAVEAAEALPQQDEIRVDVLPPFAGG